jgi:RNA polymerase sigma-54 factor
MGLSPLELELLLDKSLADVTKFYDNNPGWRSQNPPEARGNYYFNGNFRKGCESVRGKIEKARHLEIPQILVQKEENEYFSQYNSQLEERLVAKLAQFKRVDESGTPPADKIFTRQFARQREWIVKQQLAIAKYICETQEKYLESGNPFDLMDLYQHDIAEHIGHTAPSVSRLVNNLSIKLPDGRIIFAEELIPGTSAAAQKGTYALKQLQEDASLYQDRCWKVSDAKLRSLLKEKFGLELARRTVTNYRKMMA